jgi:AcrR family transcriptional regulator
MGIQERKKREKNMRRQVIQNAAKELFIVKGFNSTTIEEIAEKAELSPATIYLYFKNKGELYASLNLMTLEYLFNETKKIFNGKDLSVEEKISKFKDAMYNTYKYDPLILRNIMHIQLEDTLLTISPALMNRINRLTQKIMTMVAHFCEEGVRRGRLIEGHGMAYADIIWGLFSGLVLWEESKKRLNPQKDFLKSTLDKGFDIFYSGIKKTTIK